MEEIKATVRLVDLNGRRGPYAKATIEGVKGTITFSLESGVWHSGTIPQADVFVMLSNLQRKGKGWIAMSARLYTLADERLAETQKPQETEIG